MKSIALHHLHLLGRMRRNPITQDKVQIVFRKSSNLKELIITGLVNPKDAHHVETTIGKDAYLVTESYIQTQ